MDIKPKVEAIVKPVTAWYVIPKNGGFQLKRVIIKGSTIVEDKVFSDPDAWDQVVSILEQELGRPFA